MSERTLISCQGRTCRRQGSVSVLGAFQRLLEGKDVRVRVEVSSCLGHCGSGPTVLVLPEEIWYCRVHPDEVPAVVRRHLSEGQPILAMCCPMPRR